MQNAKFVRSIVVSLLLTLGLLPVAGAADPASSDNKKPAKQTAASIPKYDTLERLPGDVTLATLSNGLTVIVQENHVAPVATVRCYVRNTGGAFEGRYLGAGLSHLVEHLVSGGTTTNRTEKQIEKTIDTFGGATNAYTSTSLTAYFIDCPAKRISSAIDLLADSMQHAQLTQAEFDREFKVVQRELSDGQSDRGRVKWKLLNQTVYTRHPVRHPTIGYLDVLRGIDRQAALDFHRRRYVPNNQIFVVVGDVKTQDVLDRIARQWAGTPRHRETYVAMQNEPKQLTPRQAVREMDGTTYDMVFAWPTVKLSHPDLYALDVAAYILAEGESSRLVRSLKYDRQLALSVSSASYTPCFVNGLFGIFTSCTPENREKASAEILRQVYRLRDELVSPAELAKAKKQKAAELVFSQQTVQQAAESLGRNYLSTGDPLFDHSYVKNIQKVTAEQVRDVARRHFVAGRLNRITIAPRGEKSGTTGQEAAGGESPIRLVRLDNGLRVLVKRQSQLPLVNIQAYILGGGLVDSEPTAGRSALVAAMLDKGTPKNTAQQIADYFDSIGGRLSLSAGRNTVYGSAATLREDFPRATALFAECFTQPTFPNEEYAKVQKLALGAIARRADNPHQEIAELFYDNLPATSPYHLLRGGKTETVSRLSAADLRAYHRKYFVPNNMVVTIFGDIDPDEGVALVKQHFGRLKPDPAFKPIGFDRDNQIPKNIRRHKQTAKQTGMVMIGYPGTSIFNKEDYAAMTVLDAIMSGYSYPGGWLHNELRGEGLVYFVHAYQITGPAPGFFAVLSQTRPDKIDEVIERIQRNVDRAKAGKISEEECRTAVEMVISLHAQSNTTAAEQAQQAVLDELYGLGFDYDKSFDARIQAVTLDAVIRVAGKYLNKHVLVTTSPAPASSDR